MEQKAKTLKIWTFGDAHVGTDLKYGRESLAEAIKHSEAADFGWDLAVNVGDMSGAQGLPQDDEGQELVRQLGSLKQHDRHYIYSVCGNHDRSGLFEQPGLWFRKWVDPQGENTAFSGVDSRLRPYPIDGTWERYSFQVGNLLFLMLSDINEPSRQLGRGDLGGNPGGVVSKETFDWWRRLVEQNQDKIIITVHHYMLKDTTVASGAWEGVKKDSRGRWVDKYHGYKEKGTPSGASYLYWVASQPDAQAFERYLACHPGAVAIWIGGHTHTNPDDRAGGKSHIETRWGTHFINTAGLTRYHGVDYSIPMSRLLTFTTAKRSFSVRCYLHSEDYKETGWYQPAERHLELAREVHF